MILTEKRLSIKTNLEKKTTLLARSRFTPRGMITR